MISQNKDYIDYAAKNYMAALEERTRHLNYTGQTYETAVIQYKNSISKLRKNDL